MKYNYALGGAFVMIAVGIHVYFDFKQFSNKLKKAEGKIRQKISDTNFGEGVGGGRSISFIFFFSFSDYSTRS